jgi:biopolymer transport protein TolQ
MQPVDAIALPGTVTQHLSVFELFLQSDSIVKLVILLLLVASFWSWAVIFDKTLRMRRLQQAATSFEETFWSGGSLDDLFDRVGQRPNDPMSSVFAAAKPFSGPAVANAAVAQAIAAGSACSRFSNSPTRFAN